MTAVAGSSPTMNGPESSQCAVSDRKKGSHQLTTLRVVVLINDDDPFLAF
jgi:hypothetical protein